MKKHFSSFSELEIGGVNPFNHKSFRISLFKRNLTREIAKLKNAVAKNPMSVEHHTFLADLLQESGSHEAALTECHTALTLLPFYDEAEEKIALSYLCAQIYYTMGNAYSVLGRHDEARTAWTEVMDFDSSGLGKAAHEKLQP